MVVDRNAKDEMIETTDCWQPEHHGPGEPQADLMLGYRAIETARIQEGLRRLRTCFDECVSRRPKAA